MGTLPVLFFFLIGTSAILAEEECTYSEKRNCKRECLAKDLIPVPGKECCGCPCQKVCENVHCESGKACRQKNVPCLSEPCMPIPTCIDCPLDERDRCTFKCLEDGQVPVPGQECQGCPCMDVCALTDCPVGQRCEAQEVICIRAPCPPVPACVPDCTLDERDRCLIYCLERGMNSVPGQDCNPCHCQHPCQGVECELGAVCVVEEVICVRFPCPLGARCYPTCTGGREFVPCFNGCPHNPSCDDDQLYPCDPLLECYPACRCPRDKPYVNAQDQCVAQEDCPACGAANSNVERCETECKRDLLIPVPGTECNDTCSCMDPCKLTTCPPGYECYTTSTLCETYPCPQETFCRPACNKERCRLTCARSGQIPVPGTECTGCQCQDVCVGFTCDADEVCVPMDVVCVTAPCLPVPSCIPRNPCKQGTPLKPDTGVDGSLICQPGAILVQDPYRRFAVCCPESPIGYQKPCLDGSNCFCNVNDCFDDGMGYCDCPASMGCLPKQCCCRGSQVDQCKDTFNCVCLREGFCEKAGLAYCDPDVCGKGCAPERCCCHKPQPCGLPIDPGPCRASIPRWGFDNQFGVCVQFIYGGCRGNGNNFETFEECRNSCQDCPLLRCKECQYGNKLDRNGCRTCECKEQCDLPQDVGPCDGDVQRWWHNPSTRQCEGFSYGGCDGNANNFLDPGACFETCQPCPLALCLPTEPCEYGFEQFENGCFGCKCADPARFCVQPADPGPCYAHQTRYYYNAATRRCEPFVYGGCAGNANNFPSAERCEAVCGCSPFICAIYCEFGNVVDERGCLTCKCKESPCNRGIALQNDDGSNFFCGRGGERCPDGYDCVIDPADRYAVCCPTGAVGNYDPCRDGQNCQCELRYCVDLGLGYCSHPDGSCDPRFCCCAGREVKTCPGSIACVCLREGDCESAGFGYCNPDVCGKDCPPERCCCRKDTICSQDEKDRCQESCLAQGMNAVVGEECNGCPCIHPCATILCIAENVCIGVPVPCFRPPCPLVGQCVPRCSLDIDPGPCEALIPKWAFDSDSGSCVQFIYGGCEGNANRFDSYEACRDFCDPCPAILCEEKCANGYAMDANGCQTCDCIATCDLPQVPGICVPAGSPVTRYWHNPDTRQCESFDYSGCGGNANNFATEAECQQACRACVLPDCLKYIKCSLGVKQNADCCPICECNEPTDVCELPPVTGPCRAYFPRYYYNPASQQCEQFVYGGCAGNQNNFETIEACQRACVPNVCELPIVQGPCKAYIPRWGYDAGLGLCRPFIYGGCMGNANSFATFEECRDSCHNCPLYKCDACDYGYALDERGCQGCECKGLCDLSSDPGPCRGAFKRYYHDPATRFCLPFVYGGCGGNANNFETIDGCFDACRPCPVVDCVPGFNCSTVTAKTEDGCDTCTCLEQKDICSMDVEPGPCDDYEVRYYFNTEKCQCVPFIFGGCQANANNFLTKEACQDLCGDYRPGASSSSSSTSSTTKETKKDKRKKRRKNRRKNKKDKKDKSSSSTSSSTRRNKKDRKKNKKNRRNSSSSTSSSTRRDYYW